jgi:type II secretory pathway component PulC
MGFSRKTNSPAIIRILFLAAAFYFICPGGIHYSSTSSAATASSPRLVGTVQGGPFSGAVFDDGTVQTFYRLHEQLPDGSYLVKVRNDSILIKKDDGVLYEMFTTGTANSAAMAVPSPSISPAARPQPPSTENSAATAVSSPSLSPAARPKPSAPDSGTSRYRPKGRLGRAEPREE